MRKVLTFACVVAFAPSAMFAAVPAPVPVKVGGTIELDACGTVGRVFRLRADGDNFLSVRAAPAKGARELGRLKAGHLVWICEDRPGWAGIVYDPNPANQQPGSVPLKCGVSTPIAKRSAYRGPCRSGWVASAFVEAIAG